MVKRKSTNKDFSVDTKHQPQPNHAVEEFSVSSNQALPPDALPGATQDPSTASSIQDSEIVDGVEEYPRCVTSASAMNDPGEIVHSSADSITTEDCAQSFAASGQSDPPPLSTQVDAAFPLIGRVPDPQVGSVASGSLAAVFPLPEEVAATNSQPVEINAPPEQTISIRDLKPSQDTWTIIGRVLARGSAREWDSFRGGGRLFDFHIIDKNGDIIKATVFNDGVDKFDKIIQQGNTCSFSGGKIKSCNRAFSNDLHEITFDKRAEIQLVSADQVLSSRAVPNNASINSVGTLSARAKVTVSAVIARVSARKHVTTAKGKDAVKRELLLIDDTNSKIICTVWGFLARDDYSRHEGRPVMIRGAEINDYNGSRSLNVSVGATLFFDPDTPEATRLRAWYESNPDISDFKFIDPPASN